MKLWLHRDAGPRPPGRGRSLALLSPAHCHSHSGGEAVCAHQIQICFLCKHKIFGVWF